MSSATKPMLDTLRGAVTPTPPVWLMRQAGRYLPEYRALRAQTRNFIEYCLTPELAIEVTLQPIRRFALDGAILFADILLIPHVMGQTVTFGEGEGPRLEPIRDAAGLDRLTQDGLLEGLSPVMATLRGVKAALPPAVTLIGFAGAPWTVATYMIEGRGGTDHDTIRKLAWTEPQLFQRFMDILVESTSAYLIAQGDAGAEALQLFDSWAGSVPAGLFESAVIAPTKRIVDAVRARHPEVPIIGFPRAAGGWLARYAAETGVQAVGVDHMTDIGAVARSVPAGIVVQGNLDPVLLQAGGEPMAREARRIVAALQGRPFVFNLGHGVMQTTPPEHVGELVALLKAAR